LLSSLVIVTWLPAPCPTAGAITAAPSAQKDEMLPSMISATMLALEANAVIALRTLKFVSGDRDAIREAELMISEKIDAATEAALSLFWGGTALAVIDRYRVRVAANTARLTRV
jgi:hypothetical protein